MSARRAAAALALGALACAIYLPTVGFEPTYDDHHHVVNHPVVRGQISPFGPDYLERAFADQARPTMLASLRLDAVLYDGRFAGHHLSNAVLHGLVTALLFFLLVTLELRPSRAAAGAALFAVHPACTEAVASVSNREDPLAALFVLLCLVSGLHAVRARGRLAAGAWGAASGLALLFALGAKESALAATPLLAALVYAGPTATLRPRRALALALGASHALALGLFVALQVQLGAPGLRVGAGGRPLGLSALLVDRLPEAGWGAVIPLEAHRALRVVFGWPLSAEHDLAALAGPLPMAVGAAALALLVSLAWLLWRADRLTALAIVWFFVASAPVALSPWLLNPVADRFLYLPAVGALGLLGARLLDRRGPGPLILIAALSFAAPQTLARAAVWRDDVTLFTDARRFAPRSARVAQNLGGALLTRGALAPAARELERAVALDPESMAPRVNLALLATREHRTADALAALRGALALPTPPGERRLRERAFGLYAQTLSASGAREELAAAIEAELRRTPESHAALTWRRRLER